MKRFWRIYRILKVSLVVLIGLIVLTIGTIYGLSSYRLNRRHEVPPLPKLALSTDPAVLARGGHIATSLALCTNCHGADLGGSVYLDAGPLGTIVGPNLTRGQGGLGPKLTTNDWVRAIRHGVGRDGTSLLVMPSETFEHLTAADLSALVSYLRQLSPVDRILPDSELRLLGRALVAAGKLPVLSAEKTRQVPLKATLATRPSIEYGRYLATVGSCRGCHRPDLMGGPMQAPGAPPAPGLSRTHLRTWTEADFVRTLRTGRRPNGQVLHSIMPWRQTAQMTDEELHAIWLYVRSVPSQRTGVK
jgi:mono/diheme cytochrome c family protein